MTDQKCELSDDVDDSTRNCRHSIDFNYFLLWWPSKDVLNGRWLMYRAAAAIRRSFVGLEIEDNSWNWTFQWIEEMKRRWEKCVFFFAHFELINELWTREDRVVDGDEEKESVGKVQCCHTLGIQSKIVKISFTTNRHESIGQILLLCVSCG